jgi:PadR family transcriptional regulator, regulatory protein PadR
MRITLPTATVLGALSSGYGYGFEIIEATGLGAGTVYPILRRLEGAELVRSSWEAAERAQAEGRPPRRNYRMTAEGERLAQAATAQYPALVRMFGLVDGGDPAPV